MVTTLCQMSNNAAKIKNWLVQEIEILASAVYTLILNEFQNSSDIDEQKIAKHRIFKFT